MSPHASELARWRAEPWYFVRKVMRAEPDDWQLEALYAIKGLRVDGTPLPVTHRRFALQACKGPGKSAFLAWVMWWFLVCYSMAKIVACSITAENLADNLWAELAKWQKQSRLLLAAFEWTQDRVYERHHPEQWFMSARSFKPSASPDQQANTLAGTHADNAMAVLDESGGIPPGVMAAADAILANADESEGRVGLVLQAGNPTEVTGCLYEAAVRHRALWWVKEISGDPDDPKRAKRVSIQWAREQLEKYGRNHPFYMVNVLGQFPPGAANSLISLHDVVAAKARKIAAESYYYEPVVLGVDVARFGRDETSIAKRKGPLVYPFQCYRNIDLMATTGHVARILNDEKPDACFIDETGLGAGVVDRLLELGHHVIGINFAHQALEANRFLNRRAEMWWVMSEWTKRATVSLPDDPQLVSELPAPTFKYRSDGKLQLESKEDMVKRGLQSPNRADALSLTFASPVATKRMKMMQHGGQGRAVTDYDWRTGRPR